MAMKNTLQAVWGAVAPDVLAAAENNTMTGAEVQEVLGDMLFGSGANIHFEDDELVEWKRLGSEAQASALSEAFPADELFGF